MTRAKGYILKMNQILFYKSTKIINDLPKLQTKEITRWKYFWLGWFVLFNVWELITFLLYFD